MPFRFTRGASDAPRGHAILIVRSSRGNNVYATYCVALPIRFSLDQFISPILAQGLPIEARQMGDSMRFMPLPPFLEDVADVAALLALAEGREDDVIEVEESGDLNNIGLRTQLATMLCAEYGEIYVRYERDMGRRAPRPAPASLAPPPRPTLDPAAPTLAEAAPETDVARLSAVARSVGSLRYALEGQDQRSLDETKRALLRACAPLDEKYRMDDLLKAALIPGEKGQRLANLYLNRAYKLAEEDYAAIPPIEREIQTLTE